jgi:RNA polymerase sigma factor (sigma-70 family)
MRSGQPHLAVTLHAAAVGDERAWNELVARFTPLIRAVARGFRLQPHEVDDVVQGCWLALLTNFHTIRTPEALGAWLATTARRKALRALQRDVRELLTDAVIAEDQTAAECPLADLIRAEQVALLHAAIRRLRGRQRSVLECLMAEPDRSYGEVSEALGMPIGSIGPTRERGLRCLRGDGRLTEAVRA